MAVSVSDVLRRKLIFVSGKGGVGKTLVSQAVAQALSESPKKPRVLWVEFENPFVAPGEEKKLSPTLTHLNVDAGKAFEEYASMKIGVAALTRLFLQNKLMRYLSKAAPGIHELVLLGKVWHERENYDHVVVDMPSTGYGLAMFQSTDNFARLFKGGPIHRDAEAMLETFRDPYQSGSLIVALPEEMPMREGLEMRDFLLKLFPQNQPAFIANRRFPAVAGEKSQPDDWKSPVPSSAADYARKRTVLEEWNLDTWRDERIPFGELAFVPPTTPRGVVSRLAEEIGAKGYVA